MANIAAVLAVALLAIVGVSGFRATVTTSIYEEMDQGQWGRGQQHQRCRQQIQQKQQELRQCQQFLRQSQGSPFELPMYNQQQQLFRQCCQQLRNFDEQCRCEAVRHVVQQLQQGQPGEYGQGQQGGKFGGQGQQQQHQILQKARYLPQVCNLQPQECQLKQGFPY